MDEFETGVIGADQFLEAAFGEIALGICARQEIGKLARHHGIAAFELDQVLPDLQQAELLVGGQVELKAEARLHGLAPHHSR